MSWVNIALCAGDPLLWDSRFSHEKTEDLLERNRQAKILCQQCPLLEPCEKYLAECEQKDLPVAGVVAGRYSDVKTRHTAEENLTIQTTCRICDVELIPQSRKTRYISPSARAHKGEGLCEKCFLVFSRTARKTV